MWPGCWCLGRSWSIFEPIGIWLHDHLLIRALLGFCWLNQVHYSACQHQTQSENSQNWLSFRFSAWFGPSWLSLHWRPNSSRSIFGSLGLIADIRIPRLSHIREKCILSIGAPAWSVSPSVWRHTLRSRIYEDNCRLTVCPTIMPMALGVELLLTKTDWSSILPATVLRPRTLALVWVAGARPSLLIVWFGYTVLHRSIGIGKIFGGIFSCIIQS